MKTLVYSTKTKSFSVKCFSESYYGVLGVTMNNGAKVILDGYGSGDDPYDEIIDMRKTIIDQLGGVDSIDYKHSWDSSDNELESKSNKYFEELQEKGYEY